MTDELSTNADRLVTVRVAGVVQQPFAPGSLDPDGRRRSLPGMGGVLRYPLFGAGAGGWMSDHLEIGASIVHPDAHANRALQVLSCVGNDAAVLSGPAAGSRGTVVGKHGSTMVVFDADALGQLAPGDRVAIDTLGVGLHIDDEPDVALHSCSPGALSFIAPARTADGRLAVTVVADLPPEAAGAGIGMPADHLNLDLVVEQLPPESGATSLRFGDVVALEDHDHRFGRRYRPGWITVGAICHGRSVGGGHGFGMVTLLTGPRDRIEPRVSPEANLGRLIESGATP
jgi:hypothetical protein